MKHKKKVVFFGDSITQYGVYPGGYIAVMTNMLTANDMQDDYELLGAGISGNKVDDLYQRLEEDVLSQSPDIVVIWIGVNDVLYKANLGTGPETGKFEGFYVALIRKLQSKNIPVITVTPAVIGERYDNTNQLDADLDLYADIIRRLAKQYDCTLCDLRKIFIDYEKVNNKENRETGMLTIDGVHLNAKGNELVASEMMKIITREKDSLHK